jgi:hypothetical protein
VLQDIKDDGWGEKRDEEEDGNLVGTGFHGIQLTESGGYDGDDRPIEVHILRLQCFITSCLLTIPVDRPRGVEFELVE